MHAVHTRTQPSRSDSDSLSKEDWVKAARDGLIDGGLQQVKVERLCRSLGVTKGSFYWHFADHPALMAALLKHWREHNTRPFLRVLKSPSLDPIHKLVEFAEIWLTEREFDPAFESAMRQWARVDAQVAAAVRKADGIRLRALRRIYETLGFDAATSLVRARIFYYHQVGYYTLQVAESQAKRRELLPIYFEVLSGFRWPSGGDVAERMHRLEVKDSPLS